MNENVSPQNPNLPRKQRALRRTASVRSFSRQFDSSESRDLYEDSIYNAEVVGSSDALPFESEPALEASVEGEYALDSSGRPSRSSSPRSPLGELSSPHSQWAEPQLASVLEQNTIDSIRPSCSLPRLEASPERKSQIVHPRLSIRSIHPKEASASPWPLKKRLPSVTSVHHHRSLSLNDLDCLKRLAAEVSRDRSSSGGDIDRSNWCPTLPNRPVQGPPERSPTPPGLPSFGTDAAEEFRLLRLLSPGRSLWGRIWGSSHESDEQAPSSPRLLGSPALGPQSPHGSPSPPTSPSAEIFRRTLAMLGMARVVSPPPLSIENPRAPLPPNVVTSYTDSGALALADDGTYVRGRFGPRSSGHGIGGRSLEAHPIARNAQLSAIDEQVREIDKACERVDMENALSQRMLNRSDYQQDSAAPSQETPYVRTGGRTARPSELVSSSEDGHSSPAVYLSPPTSSPRIPIPELQGNSVVSALEQSHWDSMRLRSSAMPSLSRLRQTPGYPPPLVMSMRSMESAPHLFTAAEEAERARVRELVMNEKRKEQSKGWIHLWCSIEDCFYEVWKGRDWKEWEWKGWDWKQWHCPMCCCGSRGCRRSESDW
ncbi:hypothetical protein ABEF93_005001 [Exophiala dermatitidis]